MMPSNSDFESAKTLAVYLYYDGPQFYSASVGEKIFLFLGVAHDLWVCKELTTVEHLIEFEKGLLDGKDIFVSRQGNFFLWRSFSNETPSTHVEPIDLDDVIQNRWHVPAGYFFKIRKDDATS